MTLDDVIKKYSNIEYNTDNYGIGGGLSDNAFASRRHEDAKSDIGKLTFGKATDLFAKITKTSKPFIKEKIREIIPNLEWHHAGKLPKNYGGGMKKTWFVNADEIVKIAKEFQKLNVNPDFEIKERKLLENRLQLKTKFEKKYGTFVSRVETLPKYFHLVEKEMHGKYGFFPYQAHYSCKVFYSGWSFKSKKSLDKYISLL